MKKFITILLINFLFVAKVSFAGSEIQWKHYLNDTAYKYQNGNWFMQSAVLDKYDHIYCAYAQNGIDTNITIIRKYSPLGILQWERLLFPFSQNDSMVTRFDRVAKLYVDIDDNICFIIGGNYFSNGGFTRFISLTKWNQDGQQINQKIEYLPGYSCSNDIKEINVYPNGDIFLSLPCSGNLGPALFFIRGYDKEFQPIYSHEIYVDLQMNTQGLEDGPVMYVNDTSISLCYVMIGDSSKRHEFLYQVNRFTNDTNWLHTKVYETNHTHTHLNFFNGTLYLVGGGIRRYSMQGDLMAENNTVSPRLSIFDTVSNKIFSINAWSQNYSQLMIFDTVLNSENSVELVGSQYGINIKDSIIYTLGVTGAQNEQIFSISRIHTNGSLIDIKQEYFPKPISYHSIGWPGIAYILPDKRHNVTFFNNVVFEVTVPKYYANPILMQKICYDCPSISGHVYFDLQNNCLNDSSNYKVNRNMIHLMPEDLYTYTDSNGHYSFVKDSGVAVIQYINKIQNTYLCNNVDSYVINVTNQNYDSLDFGLKIIAPQIDVKSTIIAGSARPNFQQYCILDAENLSTQKVYNTTLIGKMDTLFSLNNAIPYPDSISGNTLYWHIDSMNPGEIKEFIVLNQVQAPLNYLYQHNVYVQTVGDNYLPNNTDTTNGIVIGSYDPNYKAANPVGIGPQHFIENNIPIHYYVEFQNTGTDTAFNIKIFDELDDHFDINTLVVKKSSHPMHYKVVNRQLQFYFDNILLVDSNKDYDKSIGFLTYSIMPKKCMDGTVINNNAAIYFDFNEPITTNTTYHTIGRPGCLFDNENLNDFNFFPNPVNEQMMMITVNMTTDEPYAIILTDLTGKTINQLSSSKEQKGKYQHPMYFSNKIQAGIYFLTLKTSHNNITKKVIFGH
jgi:hypothetical protein